MNKNKRTVMISLMLIGVLLFSITAFAAATNTDGYSYLKDAIKNNDSFNEEYQNGTDPTDSDSDNDGVSDGDEITNGTGPNDSDTDDDGMPDGWEVEYELNPLVNDANWDLDGDGFNNLKEYLKETLPNDRESKPKTGLPWLQLLLGMLDSAHP